MWPVVCVAVRVWILIWVLPARRVTVQVEFAVEPVTARTHLSAAPVVEAALFAVCAALLWKTEYVLETEAHGSTPVLSAMGWDWKCNPLLPVVTSG